MSGNVDISEHFQTLPYGAYDAVFQVGRHARCGTKDGFLAHTNTPNLRVALDGMLLTESHLEAWDAAVPVLGIVGDAALGRQLTGILEDTPFLAVKRGLTHWQTTPIYPNEVASNAAIHAFATRCAREWQDRKTPQLPEQFTLAVCMPSELTAEAVGQCGLKRQSASVLSVTCKDWLKDARPALLVGAIATARLLFSLMDGMDFSSEETALQFEPVKMERVRSWVASWLETDDSEWCE
jgi:D-aminopeptidase